MSQWSDSVIFLFIFLVMKTLPKTMFYYIYTCEDEWTVANSRLRNELVSEYLHINSINMNHAAIWLNVNKLSVSAIINQIRHFFKYILPRWRGSLSHFVSSSNALMGFLTSECVQMHICPSLKRRHHITFSSTGYKVCCSYMGTQYFLL